MEPTTAHTTNSQALYQSRKELNDLVWNPAKTTEDIKAFLSTYATTFTSQQRCSLLLLQRKVSQIHTEKALADEIQGIVERIPLSQNDDDKVFDLLTKTLLQTESSKAKEKFNALLTHFTKTDFQKWVKERWFSEIGKYSAEEFLKMIICERAAKK